MTKITDKKGILKLEIVFMLVYTVSYLTRVNYAAVIAEMERSTGFSRSLLSMAVTGSFVTYALGQIVSGILGDKYSPKKIIMFGLVITCLMNCLIPVFTNPYAMLVLWCINGFAQAMMWPPIVKILTHYLTPDDYKTATVRVSWGCAVGTILVYLLSPVIISLFNWRIVFFVSAFFAVLMLAALYKTPYDVVSGKIKRDDMTEETPNKKEGIKVLFSALSIGLLLIIVFEGMLRESVVTWMPSYIADTYNLGSAVSILTGVVLPVFALIAYSVAANFNKKIKNPITCAALFFGLGLLSVIGLKLVSGNSPWMSVFSSAMITGSMHGVSLLMTCMIPPYFEKYGIVSTASGVLNGATYVGSSIATYVIAVVSEKAGWGVTGYVWILIGVIGTVIAVVCIRPFKNKFMSE